MGGGVGLSVFGNFRVATGFLLIVFHYIALMFEHNVLILDTGANTAQLEAHNALRISFAI